VVWVGLAVEGLGERGDGAAGLTLDFLDVGQGDAAVIRTPGRHWILVDAGPSHEGWDAGRRIVAPFLARQRAERLAVAVLSHAHADHLGGMAAVLERYPPAQVVEPAEDVADPLYRAFLDEIAAEGWAWRPARDGQRLDIDSVRLTVLHPDTAWAEWRLDLNEDSVVLLVEYGGFRALFSGDAGLLAEARLAGRVGPVDLLKVGHHGSRSASGEAWLDELRPRAAVMSLGAGNRYGHPHAEVLGRFASRGIAVYRTDRDGTVRVTTDGRRMTIHSAGGDTTLLVGGRGGVRSEE
jgi:competence protein ComEC